MSKELFVIKRDGTIQPFDGDKILLAIRKAYSNSNITSDINEIDIIDISNTISDVIYANYKDKSKISIYDIEKTVETYLMDKNKEIAREYIGYRRSRTSARNKSSELVKKIQGLFDGSDESITAENANKDATKIHVQRDLLAGIVAKDVVKDLHMIPRKVEEYCDKNILHFHDRDYSPLFPMFNCMLIDYRTMLDKGFELNNALIEPPKSFEVACTVISQIVAAVASNIYGGQTLNRFDEGMAKYVTMSFKKILIDYMEFEGYAKDYTDAIKDIPIELGIQGIKDYLLDRYKYTDQLWQYEKMINRSLERIEKVVYDGCQCVEYQINTLSSTNGQTPFLTINFGLGNSIEARLIQKAILNVRIAGLGKNKNTPVFPKLIFTVCKGINFYKEDPNYDIKQLAMKCTSLRCYPDILNYENVCKLAGGEVVYKDKDRRVVDLEKSTAFKSPMGCRSFLHRWINPDSGIEEYEGRNNCGR